MAAVEERLGTLIVEAQRHEVWLRSESGADGAWHNALVFRRDGVHSAGDPVVTGLEWHLPPDVALQRAFALRDSERLDLYFRGLRPRPPLM